MQQSHTLEVERNSQLSLSGISIHQSQIKPSNSTTCPEQLWHTQHVSWRSHCSSDDVPFWLNPNNRTAWGATLLPCTLFLAISVNNTQSIVCGGLQKHHPWPSGGDPVYLTDSAVSNHCLSRMLLHHLLHPECHRPKHNKHSPVSTHHDQLWGNWKKQVQTPCLITCQWSQSDWPEFRKAQNWTHATGALQV